MLLDVDPRPSVVDRTPWRGSSLLTAEATQDHLELIRKRKRKKEMVRERWKILKEMF